MNGFKLLFRKKETRRIVEAFGNEIIIFFLWKRCQWHTHDMISVTDINFH